MKAALFVTLFLWTGNQGSVIKDVPAEVCKKIACEFSRRNTCPPASCDENGDLIMMIVPPTPGSTMFCSSSTDSTTASCLEK